MAGYFLKSASRASIQLGPCLMLWHMKLMIVAIKKNVRFCA